jgi:hypothetical protein
MHPLPTPIPGVPHPRPERVQALYVPIPAPPSPPKKSAQLEVLVEQFEWGLVKDSMNEAYERAVQYVNRNPGDFNEEKYKHLMVGAGAEILCCH